MCDERGISLLILQRTLHSGWDYQDYGTSRCYIPCSLLPMHACNSEANLVFCFADVLVSTSQLMSVIACSTVHKITLNIGDCFGADYFVLVSLRLLPRGFSYSVNHHSPFTCSVVAPSVPPSTYRGQMLNLLTRNRTMHLQYAKHRHFSQRRDFGLTLSLNLSGRDRWVNARKRQK